MRADILMWDLEFAAVTFDSSSWEPLRTLEAVAEVEEMPPHVRIAVQVERAPARVNGRDVAGFSILQVSSAW